eukprot:COSAG06_NODE_417_length_15986_cov_832.025493_9_plen_113_part_00
MARRKKKDAARTCNKHVLRAHQQHSIRLAKPSSRFHSAMRSETQKETHKLLLQADRSRSGGTSGASSGWDRSTCTATTARREIPWYHMVAARMRRRGMHRLLIADGEKTRIL